MKKTVIIGATNNPERYAYKAAQMIGEYGHEFIPSGITKGQLFGKDIITEQTIFKDVDTITMYVGSANQEGWYQYILDTKPNRVIFNPGTENPVLYEKLEANGISYEEACTLVLLRTGGF